MTATLKWRVDRRAETGPVINQGPRGTCLSCSISSAHHQIRGRPKCIEFLHYASSRLTTGAGSLHSVVVVLGTDGQPDENDWPYDATIDEALLSPLPPHGLLLPGDRARVTVTADADPGRLIRELESGSVSVVGLRTTPSFMRLRSGVLTEPDTHLDGHAVVLVGAATYDGPDLPQLARGDSLMCIQNSWGASWGNNGYGLIGPRAWHDMVFVSATLSAA